MTLGYRLRDARKACGYTQRELARMIGAKHNSVSNWENNQNHPDSAMLENLCRILHVTADYLLMGVADAKAAPPELTVDECSMLTKFRAVGNNARGAIIALLDYYAAAE